LRLARIVPTSRPTPRHHDAFRRLDYEKLTAALVLCAGKRAEAETIAPADAGIGLREKNRPLVRPPPMRDTFSRRDGREHDIGRSLDATYKSETGHFF
jgi:hypothetical protein